MTDRSDAHTDSPTLLVTPRRPALRRGTDDRREVLVRVQAPDAPPVRSRQRPPQALALVVDRSGSMAGRPIAEARRCAEFVVSRMRPTDVVALVAFDHRVRRLWPATPVGDGRALRSAIASIEEGGSTNLHGGWLEGVHALKEVDGVDFRRVILLSDGCANQGLTDSAEIEKQCAWWAARGITTSTYGLGRRFNEELMLAMAREGAGNGYYGERGEDLMEPFEQELELLANLAMRNVRIEVSAPDGIEVRMVNDLPRKGGGWRLPDVAWGAEAWAVARVRVPAEALAEGSSVNLLRVKARASTLDGAPIAIRSVRLSLPVMSRAAWSKLQEDPLVVRRCVELEAGEVLSRVRRLASDGDWAEVDRLVARAQVSFEGNAWVAAILKSMTEIASDRSRERTMKEAMYSSAKLRSRLAGKRELEGADSGEEAAYLRRKPTQGRGARSSNSEDSTG